MTLVEIAAALVRTTLATSAAAVVAWALLRLLRVNSPRIHRTAWLLAIAQGWLIFPLTIEIKIPTPSSATTSQVSRDALAERATPAFARHPNATPSPFTTPTQSPASAPRIPVALIAIAAWLLGAVALAAISLRRYLQVLRTLPLGSPPDDPTWQVEWQSARDTAKLRRRQSVDLRITASLGPLLHWAPWAYFILVPRELWTTLPGSQRQAILRHELAHLRRRDLWKSLAIRALALPQWFNPFAWLAIRRFDEAAEWACDDAAAASHDGPLDFANTLLAAAEFPTAPLFGGAPAARGALARRIHRLVTPRFKEESKMKLLLVPALLATLAAAQTVRVETIAAETPPVAREAKPTPAAESQAVPSLAEQQQTFDQLAKEFESFSRIPYVIEPPDVLSVQLSRRAGAALPSDHSIETPTEAPKALRVPDELHAKSDRSELHDLRPRRIPVMMDGRINLDGSGSAYVAGMTVDEATAAVRQRLLRTDPSWDFEVKLNVAQYNSKVYYVIASAHPLGDDVARHPLPYPIDGTEDVAKALARLRDSANRPINSKRLAAASITLRRPAPNGNPERVFPIIWDAVAQAPAPLTNHHLHPGDRLFVDFGKSATAPEETVEASVVQPPAEVIIRSNYYDPVIAPSSPPDESHRIVPGETLQIKLDHSGQLPTYKIHNGDIIALHAAHLPSPRDAGFRKVDFLGAIRLDKPLASITVAGLTLAEASEKIRDHYRQATPTAEVRATLLEMLGLRGMNQYKVDEAGQIDLWWRGKVAVADLSLQQAHEAIKSHLQQYVVEPRVSVEVVPQCRRHVAVFVEGGGLPSYISQIALPPTITPPPTVKTALDRAVYPTSLDFKEARLYMMRLQEGDEELIIEWDPQTDAPTPATNYPLQNGDLIAVDFPPPPPLKTSKNAKGLIQIPALVIR